MRRICLFIFVLITVIELGAQNTVLCRLDPDNDKVINVKWYCPQLVNARGFNVYRKESAGDWEKLNSQPVKFKGYNIPHEAFVKDPELKSYIWLASDPANIKDLALLAVLIKSFKSVEFSRYIGICYDDYSAMAGKEYEYKVMFADAGRETILAISEKIVAGKYLDFQSAKNISFKAGNKKVSFKWEPEPDRYFGVNIYRKTSESTEFIKITKDPILLSKTKDKNGLESYGDVFYVDQPLKAKIKYQYVFEALGFFGSPSKRSEIIEVILKDQDAPGSPDSLYNKLDGKKVLLKWRKKKKEGDLAGFNIYRTNKNDTDFVKINKLLVSVSDSSYLDTVKKFGPYFYAVGSVDADENEKISNPFFIDVYDNEPPGKPQNLTIKADSGRLTLSWNKNPEPDLKGYLVYRTINQNQDDHYVKITPTALNENVYVDALPKNIKNKFLYKIVALDESMNKSPYSDFAIAAMPDVVAPSRPFLKQVHAEKENVVIEWLINPEPDLAGYSIYRKNYTDSLGFIKLNVKLIDPKVSRFTDRYVEEDAVYGYYLQAADSATNISKASNINKVKIKKSEETGEIKFSSFEASYNKKRGRIDLKWNLKGNEDIIKGSTVYKNNFDGTGFAPISGSLEETKLSDRDIKIQKQYSYQVRVYNLRGDVYRSDVIRVDTN